MSFPSEVPPEFEDLADQIGEFIHHWGFKKVHGKIWTHLILSEEPLDAGELIRRLRISKALASMSIRDLMEYQVILEAGKSSRGTILYKPNLEVSNVIINVLRRREKRIISRIQSSYKMVRDLNQDERKRLQIDPSRFKLLGELVKSAERSLDAMIAMSEMDLSSWEKFNVTEEHTESVN